MSDYIPENIVIQILQSLPVKSLLRFQSVCKLWNQIIRSHTFAKEHLALQKPGLILQPYEIDTQFVHQEFLALLPHSTSPVFDAFKWPIRPHYYEDFRLIGTMHGVVCLCSDTTSQIVVWNPSIRKFFNLDLPGLEFGWTPCTITELYSAFWIDPSELSYKIVIFKLSVEEEYRNSEDEDSVDGDGVDGFICSNSSDWTAISLDKARCCREPFDKSDREGLVMVGGVAYWRAELENGDLVLLSFDFRDEGFGYIELPPRREGAENMDFFRLCTGVKPPHQDFLSIVYGDEDMEDDFDIYWRKEGVWAKMFSGQLLTPLRVDHVLWRVEETYKRREALSGIKDALIFSDANGCIALYIDAQLDFFFVAYDFVESLIFPIHSRVSRGSRWTSYVVSPMEFREDF